jgi:outer membrane biosynthesis protein TonB
LRPRPNNELRKIPSERKKGFVGTMVIHMVFFTFLVLVGISVPAPPEFEAGILVNFGTDETGLGMIEPSQQAAQEETSPPPSASAKEAEEEPLLTQNDEEAPAVKKVDPEAEKKKLEKTEADRKLREQLEAERIRKEQKEIERKRVEAEQQRQTDIMNRTKNALANAKNAGTSSTSEGVAGGTGNQGVPSGSVDSDVHGPGGGPGGGDKAISYDLQGRGFQRLPSPKYDYQGEGRVVVEVSVDKSGKVVLATPGVKGSTTLDEYLLRVAKEAAMEAHFEESPNSPSIQKGTITYNFILK